jgi:hypothetical protein
MYNNKYWGTSWQNIVYNAKLMNYAKTKKFLAKMIASGKIISPSETPIKEDGEYTLLGEEYERLLYKMIDAYQDKFGDAWDLHYEPQHNSFSVYFVTINDVTIHRYESKTSHLITDLIVVNSIDITSNSIFFNGMKGGRASVLKEETYQEYIHSHLRSYKANTNPFYIDNFCLGSDSDISRMLGELSLEFDEEVFQAYLYCQDSVVECESEQGGPYNYINRIVEPTVKTFSLSVSQYRGYAKHVFEQLVKAPVNVDYYLEGNMYKIQFNSMFKQFVREQTLAILDLTHSGELFCKFDGNFYYPYNAQKKIQLEDQHVDNVNKETPFTIYNGLKIPFKVKNRNRKEKIIAPNINEYELYPNFVKYVHTTLEQQLKSQALKASAIRYHNSRNLISTNSR